MHKEGEKAVEMYGNLVTIKEAYYGIESESMIVSLKNLGQAQQINEQYDEANETLERGIRIARKVIESGKSKDQA